MATEVNQSCFPWPQEESSVQDSSQGTAQVFDHGSISFGRFDLESLAWEKWSVFTNDRRHEEFVKFNGLVAKKKVYFEEYFKRIRELKALQQQNQQTELNLEYSGDGSDSSQTGEDEPVAEHGTPPASGTLTGGISEQTAPKTIPTPELECYKDQNASLYNDISAPSCSLSVGGLQITNQQIRENARDDDCSDRMDMLQKNSKCNQDDLGIPHEDTINPKITTEKCPQISQASKLIPKEIKMTPSYIPNHTIDNKGPDSFKPSGSNQNNKPGHIQPLRRPKAASSNLLGTMGRSKFIGKEVPGVVAIKRPSSPASQRPSNREHRPVSRNGSQKPAEIVTRRRPSTAEKCPVTGELAPKQANIATPRRPSTADRRPMAKEPVRQYAKVVTPRRPSTAERLPITREVAPNHAGIVSPCWPSTAERCSVARETTQKHADVVILPRPSTAERHPITRDIVQKHASVVPARRPSTAERRPVAREFAPKQANIATPRRPSTADRRPMAKEPVRQYDKIATPHQPSTAERRPITREMARNRTGIVSPRWPSTAERCPVARVTTQKHADVVILPRPSTAERRPISRDIVQKHASVVPARRPSTAERRPVARENALKHGNASSPCWPSTPERRTSRESAPRHADTANTPHRPSTGERRPITKESTLKTDPKTPLRVRAHPKGAMATTVTPKKAITPNLVKSRKPEIKSRVELHVVGKQKSSSVNFPPRKTLTTNARDQVVENIRSPTKEGILETLRSRVSASKTIAPHQCGSVKLRAPNPPPPPPPPPRQPSQVASKQNHDNSSIGRRKPMDSAPHWH